MLGHSVIDIFTCQPNKGLPPSMTALTHDPMHRMFMDLPAHLCSPPSTNHPFCLTAGHLENSICTRQCTFGNQPQHCLHSRELLQHLFRELWSRESLSTAGGLQWTQLLQQCGHPKEQTRKCQPRKILEYLSTVLLRRSTVKPTQLYMPLETEPPMRPLGKTAHTENRAVAKLAIFCSFW